MLKVLILDPDTCSRQVLRYVLERTGSADVVGESGELAEGFAMVMKLDPDAIFMETAFPDGDAIEFAEAASTVGHRPLLVFVTDNPQYAVAAFEVSAADYVMKPVMAERLMKAVGEVESRMLLRAYATRSFSEHVAGVVRAWTGGRIAVTPLGDHRGRILIIDEAGIIMVEARQKSSVIVTSDATYTVSESLGRLESQLDPMRFYRSHRGYVVNTSFITEIAPSGRTFVLKLKGIEQTAPLSREKLEGLRELLAISS